MATYRRPDVFPVFIAASANELRPKLGALARANSARAHSSAAGIVHLERAVAMRTVVGRIRVG
jgi:hypothetical protein